VSARLDSAPSHIVLSARERRVIGRFLAGLDEEVGGDLRAVWLYGSRARGERTHADSDIDLLVIAEGDVRRNQRLALALSEAAALAEGENPFVYSVHVYDPEWLRGRREIESFFIQEVDRDKVVLAGSAMAEGETR
jgi:predicted nucleotidyltransferase